MLDAIGEIYLLRQARAHAELAPPHRPCNRPALPRKPVPRLRRSHRDQTRHGVTVEPGLYAPDVGGFRHSDTVLVTEEGDEILTYYPRDLASLIIPV